MYLPIFHLYPNISLAEPQMNPPSLFKLETEMLVTCTPDDRLAQSFDTKVTRSPYLKNSQIITSAPKLDNVPPLTLTY